MIQDSTEIDLSHAKQRSLRLRSIAVNGQTYHRQAKSWKDKEVVISLVITGTISIFPALLMLFGVDFGSLNIHGPIVHTILEWSSIMVAIIMFLITFLHFHIRSDVITPIFGLALFSSGMMDMIHTLAAAELIKNEKHDIDFIPFTWAMSRLVNSCILLISTSIITYRFVFDSNVKVASIVSKKTGFKVIPVIAIILASILVAITVICTNVSLPQTQFPNHFITRPYDFIPLITYLFLTAVLGVYFHYGQSTFVFGLFCGEIIDVFVQIYMTFASSKLFDGAFNVAHFLKILSYGAPLMGLILDLKLDDIVQMVQTEIKEINRHQKRQLDLISYSRPMIRRLQQTVYDHLPLFRKSMTIMTTQSILQDAENIEMSTSKSESRDFTISIEQCVNNTVTLEYFKDYLVSFSDYERHISFWMNCNHFQQLICMNQIEHAKSLFLVILDTYYIKNGPYYIDFIATNNQIDETKTSDALLSLFSKHFFDKAQKQVLQFIRKHVWSNFEREDIYSVCCEVIIHQQQFEKRMKRLHDGIANASKRNNTNNNVMKVVVAPQHS